MIERDFKVYISIPIAGYHREEQKQMAHEAAMWLEARGLTAVNPFDNGLTEHDERHKHMAKDIEMLLSCDAIMPVGRWQESRGCKAEMLVAQETCKTIIFSPEWTKFHEQVRGWTVNQDCDLV